MTRVLAALIAAALAFTAAPAFSQSTADKAESGAKKTQKRAKRRKARRRKRPAAQKAVRRNSGSGPESIRP